MRKCGGTTSIETALNNQPLRNSFTLIELLVVMAIMSLLALMARPALNAIMGGMGVDQGVSQIQGMLEMARDEAVARHTYVWVGFATTNMGGISVLQMGAVYSNDGSGDNITPSNFKPLAKTLSLKNLALVSWSSLKTATQGLFTNGVSQSVAANKSGIVFSVGSASFSQTTLTFSPKGEAILAGAVGLDDGYNPYIDVSFRQTHGVTVPLDADDGAIVIDGATGSLIPVQIQ